jgi:hypothetical protein
MSIHDEIASDAREILSEFGKQIVLQGRSLFALISEPQETLELGAGGFTASGNFTVKVLRNHLPKVPEIGWQLSYAGENFRIVRVSNRPPHPLIALTVEPME